MPAFRAAFDHVDGALIIDRFVLSPAFFHRDRHKVDDDFAVFESRFKRFRFGDIRFSPLEVQPAQPAFLFCMGAVMHHRPHRPSRFNQAPG